jgi:hypothetical protein
MAQVEKLLIFCASPGDVPTERHYVQEVIDELNRTVASVQDIVLQVVSWENDTFPGYGMDAQALINAQIAEMAKYSLFVGIMWNRIGTPTPRATSGTAEEFDRAVAAFAQHGQPDIWFYFRQAPAKLDNNEQLEQRAKVLSFKKQVQANGMPWSYKNPSDFRNKFRNHMILWLNTRSSKIRSSELGHVDAASNKKASAEALELVDASFADEETANQWSTCPVLDIKLVNNSPKTVVIKKVEFHIKKTWRIPSLQRTAMVLPASAAYDVEIPGDTTTPLILEKKISHVLAANEADRFEFVFFKP